jgi:hypothetical protein
MATLKEIMAAKAAAQKATHAPVPPPESTAIPPREGYLVRQDGTEPLPNEWPVNPVRFATGKDLIVVQNPHLESYLAIKLPDGEVFYLLGPLQTLNIPF